MVRQTLLLLADVQLLDIVDELLFQAVLVVLSARNLLQAIDDALTDLLHTRLLVGFYRCQQLFDVINLLAKLLLQSGTLLCTEVHQMLHSLLYTTLHDLPLLVTEQLYLRLCQHVGHAHQQRHPVGVRHLVFLGKACQLLIVVLHQCLVDLRSIDSSILFYPDVKLYLTSDDTLGNELTNLHLLLSVERSNTCRQVKLLRVERLDFHIDFLSLKGHDSLAIASH